MKSIVMLPSSASAGIIVEKKRFIKYRTICCSRWRIHVGLMQCLSWKWIPERRAYFKYDLDSTTVLHSLVFGQLTMTANWLHTLHCTFRFYNCTNS